MSISIQQLKRILGSFSQIVAKDVSGIKTAYATKKDVEGFAKVSDLNNVYIKKGDIHTEDYVTNVIFRDAYQNRLVKKTDLPALDTIATKQEISDAVAAIQVPSIEGLAKESEVETKLADYAKKTELPSIEGLAKTTEVVAKSVYDEKVQSLESEISALKARLATVASGTTEQRPTENLVVGQQYFDTTLGVPVFWNGTEWHNPFAKITTVEVEPH